MSNKISLAQAMQDLKGMFPSFEEAVLKSVLYKTNGHMERTVEILLQMQAENEYKRNVPSQESVSSGGSSNSGHNDLAVFPEEKRVFPTLPKDFLIFDNLYQQQQQHYPANVAPNSNRQISEDEKLAMQLQRQMVLEESLVASGLIPAPAVRRQPQPVQSNNYQNRIGTMYSQQPQQQYQQPQQQTSSNPLSKFAETTKKKFAEFRAKFGNRSNNTARAAQTATRNGVPPPQSGGPEYSSLLQDDDDEEWNQRL